MSDPTVPPLSSPEPASGPGATPPPGPSSASPSAVTDANTAPAATGTGLAPNIAAALACLFSILGGIAFLVLEKKNQFVRFYAMQSTILGVVWIVAAVAFTIVLMILGSVPVLGWLIVTIAKLVYLAFLVVTLVTAFKAFSEKEWEIPYLGKIARQQLAKTPTAP